MKYDFKSVIDRHNTNSLKWDLFDDELPMWVKMPRLIKSRPPSLAPEVVLF